MGPSEPAMTQEEFRQLREVLLGHAGLTFKDELRFLVERRLAPRLEALGLADFGAYVHHLREGAGAREELSLAAEAVLTHETYFFRELDQLDAFANEVIPALAKTRRDRQRLRVWSAGCSTGEEPYTLAMLLLEQQQLAGWDLSVFGSDLSRRVITQARKAEYGPGAMRAIQPERLQRGFEELPGPRWRVREEVRRRVQFGQVNLVDPKQLALVGTCDAIFCRNVLIYLDLARRKQVIDAFHAHLVPGGYLFLGHSENLFTLSADFELVHLQSDLVYRRPES